MFAFDFAFSMSLFEFVIHCRSSGAIVPLDVFKSIFPALVNPVNTKPCFPHLTYVYALFLLLHTVASTWPIHHYSSGM